MKLSVKPSPTDNFTRSMRVVAGALHAAPKLIIHRAPACTQRRGGSIRASQTRCTRAMQPTCDSELKYGARTSVIGACRPIKAVYTHNSYERETKQRLADSSRHALDRQYASLRELKLQEAHDTELALKARHQLMREFTPVATAGRNLARTKLDQQRADSAASKSFNLTSEVAKARARIAQAQDLRQRREIAGAREYCGCSSRMGCCQPHRD